MSLKQFSDQHSPAVGVDSIIEHSSECSDSDEDCHNSRVGSPGEASSSDCSDSERPLSPSNGHADKGSKPRSRHGSRSSSRHRHRHHSSSSGHRKKHHHHSHQKSSSSSRVNSGDEPHHNSDRRVSRDLDSEIEQDSRPSLDRPTSPDLSVKSGAPAAEEKGHHHHHHHHHHHRRGKQRHHDHHSHLHHHEKHAGSATSSRHSSHHRRKHHREHPRSALPDGPSDDSKLTASMPPLETEASAADPSQPQLRKSQSMEKVSGEYPMRANPMYTLVAPRRVHSRPTSRRGSFDGDVLATHSESMVLGSRAASLSHTGAVKVESDLDEFMQNDALDLVHFFRTSLDSLGRDVNKPNVLITGITGVGKSSIINSIFGRDLALTGTGQPLTQHFTKYSIPEVPVNIYDSKGLEHGHHKEFIASTLEFFEEHRNVTKTGKVSMDSIHVVWYIINCASARFQEFEEDILHSVFGELPLIFLLNKSDLAPEEDVACLRKCLVDRFPNCVAIVNTISAKHAKLKIPDNCPQCGSEDVLISTRKRQGICEECSHRMDLSLDTGLEKVVEATVTTLPKVVREAFIAAQTVSFQLKNRRTARIIRDFQHDYRSTHLKGSLMKVIAKMLTRLSILWHFRQHGHLYGLSIARNIMQGYSFKDKMSLLVRRHTHSRELDHLCALGLVWNRCVRRLAMNLFMSTMRHNEARTANEITTHWEELLQTTFNDLNTDHVNELEERIRHSGLSAVLAAECDLPKKHHDRKSATVSPVSSAPSSPRISPVHSAEAISPVSQHGSRSELVPSAATTGHIAALTAM